MKLYDQVKVLSDNENYKAYGIHKGDIGIIWSAVIAYNCFLVQFDAKDEDYIHCAVHVADLEYVGSSIVSEDTAVDLAQISKYAWCIVEDGYIKNLNGDKKNKIPYDYDS